VPGHADGEQPEQSGEEQEGDRELDLVPAPDVVSRTNRRRVVP
jgi:hypothetical protein